MIIKAKWLGTPPPYANMTNGKVYTLWGTVAGGSLTVDDNGAIFAAPGLDAAAFWQLMSITDTGPVQIYP